LRFRAIKILSFESEADDATATLAEARDEDDKASDNDAVREPRILPRFANAFSSF
jgi:hypothetical protein